MIRITPATTVVCLAISRACRQALTTDVTLTLWRAGCWPQYKTECQTITDDCGTRTVPKRVEVWPVRVQYKATHVNESGMACFTLDNKFLSLSGGRYDGKLETPCGKVDLKFYKDGPLRVTGHMTVEDACVPVCGPVETCEPTPGVAGCTVSAPPPPTPDTASMTFACGEPDSEAQCDGFLTVTVAASTLSGFFEIVWDGGLILPTTTVVGVVTHTAGVQTVDTVRAEENGIPIIIDPGVTPSTFSLRRQGTLQTITSVSLLSGDFCCR